ncbi:hypothetical protein OFY17_07510 [Marinomonas sp. C2222]|uniref:Outer membrane protein assembly factor BamC n=1 Tax=Marinomonas sargassi TaxID=2984494 RepID=A0ABT2YS58_9GAMM|nr:hypothetical protein [Marinomonas sargassi]MCV2402728.1 hypothetical protein [Marinomonas sargassi]
MNKALANVAAFSVLTVSLSGCSLFYTDHSSDYQNTKATSNKLELPQGALEQKDIMVIPNEEVIADVTEVTPFTIPRSPFVFYPMAAVSYVETENSVEFSIPANAQQSKRIISDYLSSVHGEGEVIASQTETTLVTTQLSLKKQGKLAAIWSSITRLYPEKTVLSLEFSEGEQSTKVAIQFRHEKRGEEPTDWMSPASNTEVHSIIARLWGNIGRKVDESSAYLSTLDKTTDFPIWINHNGEYGIRLGNDVTDDVVESKILSAGLYLMANSESTLSPVPEEKVARVGDVIDFVVPVGNGETKKLFNVYRRDLDDVEWQEREYTYQVQRQKKGDFLVIDVSAAKYPEIVSFILAQRFIN